MLYFYLLVFFSISVYCSTPPLIKDWGYLVGNLNKVCNDNPANRYCPLIKKAQPFLDEKAVFVKRLHQLYTGDEAKVMMRYIKKFPEEMRDLKKLYVAPTTPEEEKKQDDLVALLPAEYKAKFAIWKKYVPRLTQIGKYLGSQTDYENFDEIARALTQAVLTSLEWMNEAKEDESQVNFLTGIERFFDRFLMLHNDEKIKMQADDFKAIQEMSEEADKCRPMYRRGIAVNLQVVGLLGVLFAIVLAYLVKSFFTKPSKH
jgi:hypothetical protein